MKHIKHLWIFLCMLIVTFLGLVIALCKFLKRLAEFEMQVRSLRSGIFGLAMCGSLFFGIRFVSYAQYSTQKDMQQDLHIDNTDRRLEDTRKDIDRIEAAEIQTYKEGIEYTHLINQQIKEVSERVKWDEGIGFGLFTGIGIFQGLGVWKLERHPKRRHANEEDDD